MGLHGLIVLALLTAPSAQPYPAPCTPLASETMSALLCSPRCWPLSPSQAATLVILRIQHNMHLPQQHTHHTKTRSQEAPAVNTFHCVNTKVPSGQLPLLRATLPVHQQLSHRWWIGGGLS